MLALLTRLGAVKLEVLNTPTIQRFYNQLLEPGKTHAALSPKTIKNVHGILHKALQQAVSIGYLRFNPADACSLPRVIRQEQLQQQLLAGQGWVKSELVFTNEIGDRLSYRTVYDCFKRIVAKIDCPSARFHDLRHTYATMSLAGGDIIKTVQENLRHHAASFTLDVYGHVTDRMRKQNADRMEQRIQVLTAL